MTSSNFTGPASAPGLISLKTTSTDTGVSTVASADKPLSSKDAITAFHQLRPATNNAERATQAALLGVNPAIVTEADADADFSNSLARAKTLAEIPADPKALAAPEVVVPKLAWRGRVSLLASREKVGKSTLMGAAAAAVSSGDLFAGQQLSPGRVLLVGLEEHVSDMARRLVDFGANPDWLYILDTVSCEPLEDLADDVDRIRPHLMIVDTLPKLVEGLIQEAGSAAQWTPVMSALTRLARDFNMAVVLLHHCRKSDGSYRDSTAVGAGVDAIFEMDCVADDPAVRRFKVRARWRMDDFSLRFNGTSFESVTGAVSLETQVLFFVQGTQDALRTPSGMGLPGSRPTLTPLSGAWWPKPRSRIGGAGPSQRQQS